MWNKKYNTCIFVGIIILVIIYFLYNKQENFETKDINILICDGNTSDGYCYAEKRKKYPNNFETHILINSITPKTYDSKGGKLDTGTQVGLAFIPKMGVGTAISFAIEEPYRPPLPDIDQLYTNSIKDIVINKRIDFKVKNNLIIYLTRYHDGRQYRNALISLICECDTSISPVSVNRLYLLKRGENIYYGRYMYGYDKKRKLTRIVSSSDDKKIRRFYHMHHNVDKWDINYDNLKATFTLPTGIETFDIVKIYDKNI